MSDVLLIQANLREKVGTGPARNLRRAGGVPAVVYGNKEEVLLISLAQKDADMVYNKSRIRCNMIDLNVGDKNLSVLPKQFSVHPVTDNIEHIDFMFTDKLTEVSVNIPVRIKGKDKCVGIKKGGVINVVFKVLKCKVMKDKIPPFIEIDVTEMNVGTILALRDLVLPPEVKLLARDLNQTFLRISGKRKVVEEAEIKAGTAEGEAAAGATVQQAEGKEAAEKAADAASEGEKKPAPADKKEKGGEKK